MSADYTKNINSLYQNILGREGEAEGLSFYNDMFNRLANDDGKISSENLNSVVDQFLTSPEAKQLGRSVPLDFAAQFVSEMGGPRSNSDATWLSSLQGPTAAGLQDRFTAGEGRAGTWDATTGKWIDPFEGNYIFDPRMQSQFGTPYFLPNTDHLGTPQNGSILGGFVGANDPANWYKTFGVDTNHPNFSSNVSDFTSKTGEFTRSGGLFDPTKGNQNPDGTFTYFSNTIPEQLTSQWHDDEDDGFGDLLKIAAIGAATYFGLPAMFGEGALGLGGAEIFGPAMESGLMGTTAMGAGLGYGLELGGEGVGAGLAGSTAAAPGSIAAQWAGLEGTPTLVMGGDVAAGGLGGFASEAGFEGAPQFFDDAIGQKWYPENMQQVGDMAGVPRDVQGALSTANQARGLYNAANSIGNMLDLPTTVSGLRQQGQQQSSRRGRDRMTSPFGNRNFDAYTGV
jgi:hypothetical protein